MRNYNRSREMLIWNDRIEFFKTLRLLRGHLHPPLHRHERDSQFY